MPIYVYHCPQCEEDFERMVRFSEMEKPQECPTCGSADTQKRVTRFASYGAGTTGASSNASSCSGGGGRFT